MIIVGDLHGEIKKLGKIIKKFGREKLLFLGDYCDSFDRSDNEIISTLLLVLETGDIVLVGNHELNYYNDWGMKGDCSGYRKSLQEKIQKIFELNRKKFKFFHYD